MDSNCRIIGVDPSGESCGMVVLDDGYITAVFNIINENFYSKVTNFLIHRNCTVVIEDITPYSLRLMPQVIDTCKFIGEVTYRLRNEAGAKVVLVPRYYVKRWVFDTFPGVCLPIIDKKMDKKGLPACSVMTRDEIKVYPDGREYKKKKASFIWVDDKCVTESMKHLYKIPLPKAGKGYMNGLIKDSWQALALASYWHIKQKLKA